MEDGTFDRIQVVARSLTDLYCEQPSGREKGVKMTTRCQFAGIKTVCQKLFARQTVIDAWE